MNMTGKFPSRETAIAGIGATEFSKDSGRTEMRLAVEACLAALADAGVRHQYREYQSGHNWVTWKAALPEALLYMQGK